MHINNLLQMSVLRLDLQCLREVNKAIDEGPYEFRIFTPFETEAPRMQKEEDLRGDDLKHYEAEIEAMNLFLISILNDIYKSVDACTTAKAMWQRVERLMRGTVQNQVDKETRFNNEFDQFVAEPGEALVLPKYVTQVCLAKRLSEDFYDDLFDYLQQFKKLVNASRAKKLEKYHDPLALVVHTGSLSRTSSPYYVTHPSSVVDYDDDYQGDIVQNKYDDPLTSTMILLSRAITQTSIIQQITIFIPPPTPEIKPLFKRTLRTASSGTIANVQCYNCSEKGYYARNCPKPRIRVSKYFMEQMLLEKQDEAGVILTDEQNDFLFADVQTPSTSYVNPLFAKDNQEQKYPTQPKIINKSIGDDQIDSNIIFDEPNEDVNSGSVENDNNVQDSYELEQLARNAYKEAEKQQIIAKKVQQQNIMLTKQLELYKEKVRVFEITKEKTTNYFNEYIEADQKAKRFEQESQSQFIRDRDIIRDLEQQRDKLDLNVVELKRQTVELQKTQSILKRKMSENEDQYHDTVLNLEAKVKKNVDTVLKIKNSLQGMFMLGPKPMSFYDSKLKHGLGDTEDILEDATKSQIKMKNKMEDPIAIEKKQNVSTIGYKKLNAL
ncbi:integrase, catalytic region, zinc finger, CCHC-type containing protein [Tanacetum coccineum]